RAEKAIAEQLRCALAKHRQRQRHGKYPKHLRERACRYTSDRQSSGVGVGAIAKELGVPKTTAERWTIEEPVSDESRPVQVKTPSSVAGMSFVPVVVRPAPSEWRAARLEVDFADGTRLQAFGVGPEVLATTLQTLRRQG
ncbi:hypothetical protein ACFL5O_10195, partial [Myxococcota bacterium]